MIVFLVCVLAYDEYLVFKYFEDAKKFIECLPFPLLIREIEIIE